MSDSSRYDSPARQAILTTENIIRNPPNAPRKKRSRDEDPAAQPRAFAVEDEHLLNAWPSDSDDDDIVNINGNQYNNHHNHHHVLGAPPIQRLPLPRKLFGVGALHHPSSNNVIRPIQPESSDDDEGDDNPTAAGRDDRTQSATAAEPQREESDLSSQYHPNERQMPNLSSHRGPWRP